MKWNHLTEENQLDLLIENSSAKPQFIFKHSTSCGISRMVLKRLEAEWIIEENKIDLFFLDLLSYRIISNRIASEFNVHHESPQVIILKNKEVVYHTSHQGILAADLKESLALI